MIEVMKDTEIRDSGIIYSSTLQQIKQLHSIDPVKAGEFAISAIELLLTGEISSDDAMIKIMLIPANVISKKNQYNYDMTCERNKKSQYEDGKFELIAELVNQGKTQTAIAKELGVSQQTISKRIKTIKNEYPQLLLQPKSKEINKNGCKKIQDVVKVQPKNDCTTVVQEKNGSKGIVESSKSFEF